MKFFKYCMVMYFGAMTCAHAESLPMKKYENEIIKVDEIAGVASYTLVLSCTQLHPIVVYAPNNFSESQQDQVHRYVLPNTTLSENVDNQHALVQQDGHHVEVLLFGSLLLQTTGNHKANFMVSLK